MRHAYSEKFMRSNVIAPSLLHAVFVLIARKCVIQKELILYSLDSFLVARKVSCWQMHRIFVRTDRYSLICYISRTQIIRDLSEAV